MSGNRQTGHREKATKEIGPTGRLVQDFWCLGESDEGDCAVGLTEQPQYSNNKADSHPKRCGTRTHHHHETSGLFFDSSLGFKDQHGYTFMRARKCVVVMKVIDATRFEQYL